MTDLMKIIEAEIRRRDPAWTVEYDATCDVIVISNPRIDMVFGIGHMVVAELGLDETIARAKRIANDYLCRHALGKKSPDVPSLADFTGGSFTI